MTRDEFERKRHELQCRYCNMSSLKIAEEAKPPHTASIICTTCGRHHEWLASDVPGAGDSGEWRESKKKNGNVWRKRSRVLVVVFKTKEGWKWVREDEFSAEVYPSKEAACAAAEERWP
jgi:hypothetical protein